MLAWVTGATGFVGGALVERLSARGDTVVALVRPSSKTRAPRGARIADGVLPDVAALSVEPRPDVVFHCAAAIDCDEATGHAVHVEATMRLAEAARGARFVHLSTTDVLPPTSSVPLSEATPCAPHSPYGRTKLEGETRLLGSHPDAVVLRPPGIYGPGATRDFVLHVAKRIARGRFFYLGDGSARRSWIFVETLVDAMLYAAERPALTGPFFVDDGRSVSRREFAEAIALAMGRPVRFPKIPRPIALAAAWAFERAAPPLGLRPPLTRALVRASTSSLPLDTTRWKKTGFSPRFSLQDAMAATVRWERETGRLRA